MIRAGFASDKRQAVSLYKTTEDGTCMAGLILAGFGTQPIPDTICDDAIQNAVDFAAYYIQKALAPLLDTQCTDMENAKSVIGTRLTKLNDSITFISRKTGQGIYLSGTVCYIADNKYICVSFGHAYASYWFSHKETILTNWDPEEPEPQYIEDAIGGTVVWSPNFFEGEFAVGSQILFVTRPPAEDLLPDLMSELIHTNQIVLPVSIYKGLPRTGIPLAVLSVTQAADYRKVDAN